VLYYGDLTQGHTMHRFIPIVVLAACICGSFSAVAQETTSPAATATDSSLAEKLLAEKKEGFLPLFNGKLLSTWEGKAYWFRVEDSAIVAGRLDQAIPNNFFLCTTQKYSDFELRLQLRVVGEGVNAGVQFRTKRIPEKRRSLRVPSGCWRRW
jgi:hypothetical protein